MNRLSFIIFIFFCAPSFLFAQKTPQQDFKIILPERKIQNSLYNSIRIIDARPDTTFVGIVQRSFFNIWVRLVVKEPIKEQLQLVFQALTDSTTKGEELVLVMRQLGLVEFTAGLSGQKGYCYMRANLFAGNNGTYKKLSDFDSVVTVKSSYDVTKDLLKTGSEVITGFLAGSLLNKPSETENFTLNDIYKIDSFEKRTLAAYNTGVYKDGVYRTFQSFVDQTPDGQITAKVKKNEIWDIFTLNKKGKKEKVWQKDTYAVIYNGVPYISTEFDYYPLIKKDGDFYFTGKARAIVFSADAIVTSVLFLTLLGGFLMPYYGEATFDMKIDHLNGGFIRLRQVKK